MPRYWTSTPATRAATLRLMNVAGRMSKARDTGDWLAYADARTSAEDAREALRLAVAMGAGR